MKLPQLIRTKHTSKLFFNKYKYKVVLISAGASWFRGNNVDYAHDQLQDLKSKIDFNISWKTKLKRDVDEQKYIESIIKFLRKVSDYDLRVESPLLSFYTNIEKDVELLVKIDSARIKYVSYPEDGDQSNLGKNQVISKKLDYQFKITMGRTRQDYTNFIEWSKNNTKIRMPKRAKKDLTNTHSWGGCHFYVKDDKTLTMVKMFLGSDINKVENVIKL